MNKWFYLIVFAAINLVMNQTAMMTFAEASHFNPLITGRAIAELSDGYYLFPPFAFVSAFAEFRDVTPALLKTPLTIAVGGLIGSVLLCVLLKASGKKNKVTDSSGSARWATFPELKKKKLIASRVGEKEGTIIGCWDVGAPYEERLALAKKFAGMLIALPKLMAVIPGLKKLSGLDQVELAWKLLRFIPGKRYYIVDNEKTHLLVCAPSRSGKGIGAVIPTLLNWRDSCVVADPKRENLDITGGFREKVLHHKVVEFAPTDQRKTYRFNLVNEIRWGTAQEGRDVANVVDIIVGKGSGNDAHWIQNAKSLIIGVLTHLKYKHSIENLANEKRPGQKGYRETNMYDVYEFLSDLKEASDESGMNGISRKIQDEMDGVSHFPTVMWVPNETSRMPWLNIYIDSRKAHEITHWTPEAEESPNVHPVVASSFGTFLSKAPNEASGVVSTAVTALQIFSEKIIVDNTCTSDFFLTDLRNLDEPMDLFLVVPPSDLQRVGPLFRLIVEMTVIKSTETLNGWKHRCLLLIDEFPAFGKMENLVAELGYIAGYGLKTMIIVQGLEQIKERYKSMELLTNCQTQVFFGPNDQTTRNYLSELLGSRTIIVKSVAHDGGFLSKKNITESEKDRRLLTPDETSTKLANSSAMVIEGLNVFSPKNKYFLMEDFQKCIREGKALTRGQIGLRPVSFDEKG